MYSHVFERNIRCSIVLQQVLKPKPNRNDQTIFGLKYKTCRCRHSWKSISLQERRNYQAVTKHRCNIRTGYMYISYTCFSNPLALGTPRLSTLTSLLMLCFSRSPCEQYLSTYPIMVLLIARVQTAHSILRIVWLVLSIPKISNSGQFQRCFSQRSTLPMTKPHMYQDKRNYSGFC